MNRRSFLHTTFGAAAALIAGTVGAKTTAAGQSSLSCSATHTHSSTGTTSWYSTSSTPMAFRCPRCGGRWCFCSWGPGEHMDDSGWLCESCGASIPWKDNRCLSQNAHSAGGSFTA